MKGYGLDEGVSSRLLVYVGRLMTGGLSAVEACRAAISQTLTEEEEVMEAISNIVNLYFGELMQSEEEAENA